MCGGVGRHGDVVNNGVPLAFPRRDYVAVGAVMTRLKIIKTLHKVRFQKNIFKTRIALVDSNASQSFKEPSAYFPKHNVVKRDVPCGVYVPVFIEGSRPVNYPPPPRRIGVLRS